MSGYSLDLGRNPENVFRQLSRTLSRAQFLEISHFEWLTPSPRRCGIGSDVAGSNWLHVGVPNSRRSEGQSAVGGQHSAVNRQRFIEIVLEFP